MSNLQAKRGLVLSVCFLPLVAAQCSAAQDFTPRRFSVIELDSGVPYNNSLCPLYWAWFQMPTHRNISYTQLVQGSDGIWSPETVTKAAHHAVSIAVDAGYDFDNYRYTSLTVFVVNGTPPGDFLRSEPYVQSEGEYVDYLHTYVPHTDRETITYG